MSGCDVGCIPQAKDKPDVQWGVCKCLYTDPMSCTYAHGILTCILKFLLHL